jgi:subtilase family serine protease
MPLKFKKPVLLLLIAFTSLSAFSTEKIVTPKITIAVPKPDLLFEAITMNPAAPAIGETIHFEAIVINRGRARSVNCKMTFAIGGESTPATAIVPPLNPGERWIYTRDYAHTRALRYRATAVVDVANVVAESNELNNTRYIDYTVIASRKPDLIVESITADPGSIFSYQSSVITVKFKNIGSASAGGPWKGALYINGELAKEETLPDLEPGASAQITFTFGPTNEANPEHRKLRGVADTDNTVNELDETNNEKTGILYVAS